MQISVQRMVCTGCGAEANASCDCGKPYIPAKVRAAEAIKANPQKSDRAIADEIGVGATTVNRARKETGAPDGAPVEREGRDGKVYRLPTKERPEPDGPSNETLQSLLTLIDLALRVADLNFSQIKPTPQIRTAIRRVIETWTKIEGNLE
jgi:hypothetical protein